MTDFCKIKQTGANQVRVEQAEFLWSQLVKYTELTLQCELLDELEQSLGGFTVSTRLNGDIVEDTRALRLLFGNFETTLNNRPYASALPGNRDRDRGSLALQCIADGRGLISTQIIQIEDGQEWALFRKQL